MPQVYNITFERSPGSLGTLIEYKESTSTTWIKPNAPANPTSLDHYSLSLDTAKTYDVRLSSVALNCTKKYRYLSITVPAIGKCCPINYVLAPDETYCYKVEEVTAAPPQNAENAVAVGFSTYSMCGSRIYAPGYLSNGTGPSIPISTANSFWVNGVGNCNVPGNATDGPMNRCAVWSPSTLNEQQIGFSVCVNLEATKTYYIGFGVDNIGILKIDGNTVIHQDRDALDTLYGATEGSATFRIWHIYPVTLSAGEHIIEMVGHNVTGTSHSNPAALGAEIYDNTPEQIAGATSYTDLNMVFSTKDYVGRPIQMGTNGIGYSCPEGFSLTCGAPFSCKRIVTTSTFPC